MCQSLFWVARKMAQDAQNISDNRRIVDFKNSNGTRIASFTGTGLIFGNDDAAANALDDYEEGDWVPATFNGLMLPLIPHL